MSDFTVTYILNKSLKLKCFGKESMGSIRTEAGDFFRAVASKLVFFRTPTLPYIFIEHCCPLCLGWYYSMVDLARNRQLFENKSFYSGPGKYCTSI